MYLGKYKETKALLGRDCAAMARALALLVLLDEWPKAGLLFCVLGA